MPRGSPVAREDRRVREVPRAQGLSAGPEMSERSREVWEIPEAQGVPGGPERPRCSFHVNSPPPYLLNLLHAHTFQNAMVIER